MSTVLHQYIDNSSLSVFLPNMADGQVGERSMLTISPDFAYGTIGIKQISKSLSINHRIECFIVPPNSVLIFDVELIKFN